MIVESRTLEQSIANLAIGQPLVVKGIPLKPVVEKLTPEDLDTIRVRVSIIEAMHNISPCEPIVEHVTYEPLPLPPDAAGHIDLQHFFPITRQRGALLIRR
jgi:hypothetical protein